MHDQGTAVGTARLKQLNTDRVMNELRRREEPVRIVELAHSIGLARPTVAQIVEELTGRGWLSHHEPIESLGRPAVRVAVNRRRFPVIGIDLGAHRVAVRLCDAGGAPLATAEIRHSTTDGRELLKIAGAAISKVTAEAHVDADEISVTTAASVGIVDHRSGRVRYVRGIDKWSELDLVAELSALVGGVVAIDNDANLAAQAMLADDQPSASFLTIQWGARLGAGLVLDRRLYHGVSSAAGEIGALRVRDAWSREWSSLEGAVGAARIAEVARLEAARDPNGTFARDIVDIDATEYVFRRASEGNRTAIDVVERIAGVAAEALAPICLALDLDRVYITGGIARAGAVLTNAVERGLNEISRVPISVLVSPYAEDTVVHGAVAASVERLWDELVDVRTC
ncbi:ROK family transcriptional regulator [Agromyces humatus]|uniref:ROK family transcriptional regulator n=1 Tax=Agromyces humatus TaxID=279573 RepID=A0ABN2KQ79_9MICO|nr:ROK family transcriptional regulator [Agromyces humatus]